MVKDILSAVMYHRNIVLFIHLPVLNQLDLNIHSGKKLIIVPVILGMSMMMILIHSYTKWGVEKIFLDGPEPVTIEL